MPVSGGKSWAVQNSNSKYGKSEKRSRRDVNKLVAEERATIRKILSRLRLSHSLGRDNYQDSQGDNLIDRPRDSLKALKNKDSQKRKELGVLMGEQIFRQLSGINNVSQRGQKEQKLIFSSFVLSFSKIQWCQTGFFIIQVRARIIPVPS